MIEPIIAVASRATRLLKSRRGQSLAEYALVLTFLSLLSVVVVSVLGVQLRGVFTSIAIALDAAWNAI